VSPIEASDPGEIAAEVRRSTWWAYRDPRPPGERCIRAIIEVVGDSHHEDWGVPPRLVRRAYVYYLDALDFTSEQWLPIVDRFSQMTDDEFHRLVLEREVVPLSQPTE
jgi:hypothetical protein